MEYILNSLHRGILKIELNRPQKRNALTLDMYTEVRSAAEHHPGKPQPFG
jgi:enoyl-CoA hydratase/carnithine racemase